MSESRRVGDAAPAGESESRTAEWEWSMMPPMQKVMDAPLALMNGLGNMMTLKLVGLR